MSDAAGIAEEERGSPKAGLPPNSAEPRFGKFDSVAGDAPLVSCQMSDLGLYRKRRTFRTFVQSPYEQIICELMGQRTPAPPHDLSYVDLAWEPADRRLVVLRTIDKGDWDNAAASSTVTTADLSRKVVYLPAWLDRWGPVNIYTLVRDGNVDGTMSDTQKTAVLSMKLMLEMLARSLPPLIDASVSFAANDDNRLVDLNSPALATNVMMPARTAANPGYTARAVARMLGRFKYASEPADVRGFAPLGVELREPVVVDSQGQVTSFSNAPPAFVDTQLWWRNNAQWHSSSERWDAGVGTSENRLLLRLGYQASRPFAPESWLRGPRTAFPDFAQNTATGSPQNCANQTVTHLKPSRAFTRMMHETGHLALKQVGLVDGHGGSNLCRGISFGEPTGLDPIPLYRSGQPGPVPAGQLYGTHWYTSHFAALFNKVAFGLDWNDPLGWPYTVTAQTCAGPVCVGPFVSNLGITCGGTPC